MTRAVDKAGNVVDAPDLDPLPDGCAWKLASDITIDDVLRADADDPDGGGPLDGRVVEVDHKPKTVWITIAAVNPRYLGARIKMRPRHDDRYPVVIETTR